MEKRRVDARTKAKRYTIFLEVVLLFGWLFLLGYQGTNVYQATINITNIIISIIFVGFMILVYKKVYILFLRECENVEKIEESKKYVEDNLSTKVYKEVLPIKAYKHEEFILGLINKAKFYAIIKDDVVSINLKFNDEKDLRFLEYISKGYFNFYYKLNTKQIEEDKLN